MRLLLRWAYTRAVDAHVQSAGEDEAAWRDRLPAAPFDLGFYLDVVAGFLGAPGLLAALLGGQDAPLPPAPPPRVRTAQSAFSVEERAQPLGGDEADRSRSQLGDPAAQRLLGAALAWARRRFTRQQGQSAEDFAVQLPVAPFDLGFYARALASMFTRRDWLEAMLRGENPDALAAL